MKTFEELFQEHAEFVKATFPKSHSISSLTHLKREIEELEKEITVGDISIYDRDAMLKEMADCFLCLMSAAAFIDVSTDNLLWALYTKLQINKNREWKLNPDNTYSHVK